MWLTRESHERASWVESQSAATQSGHTIVHVFTTYKIATFNEMGKVRFCVLNVAVSLVYCVLLCFQEWRFCRLVSRQVYLMEEATTPCRMMMILSLFALRPFSLLGGELKIFEDQNALIYIHMILLQVFQNSANQVVSSNTCLTTLE